MRAELVITNKVNEAIGMAKPLITRRNAPVQELLTHGEDVWLVDPASPQAIADAILTLKNDPALRTRIAENGHRRFLECGTIERLGASLEAILQQASKRTH
jgi:glycosyltransferase involved in cell wall biosynthesis